uniref:Uncharacterized protein n=1 Tax=Anguilla anguilla TaxID=7936 RepID=A0A0E9WT17_ANGAN
MENKHIAYDVIYCAVLVKSCLDTKCSFTHALVLTFFPSCPFLIFFCMFVFFPLLSLVRLSS